jgi:hypothetical protein
LLQLKGISGEKFEKAVEFTNTMRGTYVDDKRRRKGGRSQIVPFPVILVEKAGA